MGERPRGATGSERTRGRGGASAVRRQVLAPLNSRVDKGGATVFNSTGEFWQEAEDLSQLPTGSYGPSFFGAFERTIRRANKCPVPHLYFLILKSPTSQELLIESPKGEGILYF